MDAGAPVDLVFDPQVANARVALLLALVTAVFAYLLGLPDQRGRRR